MKKNIPYLVLAMLCLNFSAMAQEKLKGRVVDAQTQEPLAGALIKIKTPAKTVISNSEGYFELNLPKGTYELQVQYLAYGTKELLLQLPQNEPLLLQLNANENNLQEVQVVSTGYQTLPKERATGSFVLIDSALLNRSVGTNILDRLDGIASGLVFNRNRTQDSQSEFNIRGRSTIFGEDRPLIVLDNFPFEGELNSINPNDIKSIVLLKDAAAASIWGTRAGNGVVVITTYSGSYASKTAISVNTNVTISGKPDLYQAPWFANEDWLEIEQFLFNKGAFNTTLNNRFGYISEGVAIMDRRKRNLISSTDSLEMINRLKGNDIRSQMLDHLYRTNLSQQYALNLSGGGEKHKYLVSAAYDGDLGSRMTDFSDRITLSMGNTFKALKDKMEINTRVNFSTVTISSNPNTYASPNAPYEQIVDANRQALPVQRDLRFSYIDTVGRGSLLDWRFFPLHENRATSKSVQNNYLINAGINYSVAAALKFSLLYQHQRQQRESTGIHEASSYYVRDLINRYSVINYAAGMASSPIPTGEVRLMNSNQFRSNYGRAQFNFNEKFFANHELTAIGGVELRSSITETAAHRLYGFNPETYVSGNASIDFTRNYPILYSGGTGRIELGNVNRFQTDRYLSYYANLSYTMANRYVLTFSARKDESNLFGVKSNQKGVPLWSAGALWDIAKENFYELTWLPQLTLKASYGYSGNVSKSLSAYLTASPQYANSYGVVFNSIINPPNPSLRWERVRTINIGLTFATKGNRIKGSIEPYLKHGLDLFGESPLAPQTGVATYSGNSANTTTKGIDIALNTLNLISAFKWSTDLNFSANKDRVTAYLLANGLNSNVITQTYNNPLQGYPYFAIYGYRWAGLDAQGDPQLFLNNQPTKTYASVANSNDRSNIRYIGSTVPTVYGNIINSFSYRAFELSFNITYRLGYYFRRNSLNNALLYSSGGFTQNIDYEARWQKAGDELHTQVPALLYPNVTQRNNAYTYADILVEKADNVKLQDIRMLWDASNLPMLKNRGLRLKLYCNIANLGYLWLANNFGLDPDVPRPNLTNTTAPRTFSFGLKADL